MNLILLLTIGGLVGWVASVIAKDDQRQIIMFNIGAGMAGALLTGLIASTLINDVPIMGAGLPIATLALSPLGAGLMVTLTALLQRGACH